MSTRKNFIRTGKYFKTEYYDINMREMREALEDLKSEGFDYEKVIEEAKGKLYLNPLPEEEEEALIIKDLHALIIHKRPLDGWNIELLNMVAEQKWKAVVQTITEDEIDLYFKIYDGPNWFNQLLVEYFPGQVISGEQLGFMMTNYSSVQQFSLAQLETWHSLLPDWQQDLPALLETVEAVA